MLSTMMALEPGPWIRPLTSTTSARPRHVVVAVRLVLPTALWMLAHAFVARCDGGWTRAWSEEQTEGG